MVDIRKNPACVILDLGCTKPMGSRQSLAAFMKEALRHGIECTLIPTSSKFTFANGNTSDVTQACLMKFPTNPPTWTVFDIVEQGHVPILLSLGQMKHLRFTLDMTPGAVYLTCEAFGVHRKPLRVACSSHAVLDLASLKYPSTDQSTGAHVFIGEGTTTCPACRGSRKINSLSRFLLARTYSLSGQTKPLPSQ